MSNLSSIQCIWIEPGLAENFHELVVGAYDSRG